MKMKKTVCVILILVMLLCLASCGDGSGGSFSYALSSSPSTLDPQYTQGSNAQTIINNCFEGLVRLDENGEVTPGVAESWEISADGLKYTFHLRNDSEWCVMKRINASTIGEDYEEFDNRVTAYDFAFAFTRAVKAETECPELSKFLIIKNARQVNEGTLSVSSLGVGTPDDFTLTVTLEHRCLDFLDRLAGTAFMPCNEEFFNLCAGRYGLNTQYLLCNGPFYAAAWDASSSLTLRNNRGYSGEKKVMPASVTIYFNNNADEIARNVSIGTYSAAAFTDIDSVPAQQVSVRDIDDTVYGFCFNCADAFLANEYVRLALMFCVKKDLFEPPEGCSFTRSCVPVCCKAGELNYREQVSKQMPTITYDEERALEYWNAGLEVLGVKSLGISLLCEEKYSSAIRSQIQIWQQVFSVSLSVNIVTDTENNIEKLLAGGEYQFAFAPIHSSDSSAADYLAGFIPGKSTNIFGFEGEEYEKMINGALNVESQQDVLNGCFSADSYLIKHAIFYPVFTGKSCFVTHNSVQGIQCSVSGNNILFTGAIEK